LAARLTEIASGAQRAAREERIRSEKAGGILLRGGVFGFCALRGRRAGSATPKLRFSEMAAAASERWVDLRFFVS